MRTARTLLGAVLMAASIGCKHSPNHLPPQDLAPVLADLHLADAYSNMVRDSLHPATGKNYDSLAVWTKAILAKHHLSRDEFSKSMDWYRDNPTDLDSLYAKVIPILEREKR